MRIFTLILMAFLLTGCLKHAPKEPLMVIVEPPQIKATQVRPVCDFSQLIVKGQINVNLRTGYARPQIILQGDPRDLEQVTLREKDNRLLVSLGKGYPRHGAVYAEIRAKNLNRFTFKGAGIVKGTQLYSNNLDIFLDNAGDTTLGGNIRVHKLEIHGKSTTTISGLSGGLLDLCMVGKPKVRIAGVANLRQLSLKGGGSLSLYWVKSDYLKIRAKNRVFIQLAGVANKLDVELWDHARFKGRYLRADRAFVKTHGHAIAELSAVKRQHTLASDASDIYFYNIPVMKTDYMAYNGAVLDMRDWRIYALQEYDRYNKQLQLQ